MAFHMLLGPLSFIPSGFVVRALVGMTASAALVDTPLLVLIFGIHPITAVGTDLLYAAVTKTGGTFVHHRRGTINWLVTRRLATGSIPAAILTLIILYKRGVQGGDQKLKARRAGDRLSRRTTLTVLFATGYADVGAL